MLKEINAMEVKHHKDTDQRSGLEWNNIQQKMALNKLTNIEETIVPLCNARISSL
jgi:hypothetical protein